MLTPVSERCSVCWQPILYRPDERDVCEACRLARGEPHDLFPFPIVYRPQEGDACPDCGAVLDAGMTRHPDCISRQVREEHAAMEARTKREGRRR